MCRAQLVDKNCLVLPAAELGNEEIVHIDTDTQSSKTEALMSILTATHKKEGSKVIIFSQLVFPSSYILLD